MDTEASVDLSPILKNQDKLYNLIYTDSIVFFTLLGLIIALLIVLIFAKGFGSNDR